MKKIDKIMIKGCFNLLFMIMDNYYDILIIKRYFLYNNLNNPILIGREGS